MHKHALLFPTIPPSVSFHHFSRLSIGDKDTTFAPCPCAAMQLSKNRCFSLAANVLQEKNRSSLGGSSCSHSITFVGERLWSFVSYERLCAALLSRQEKTALFGRLSMVAYYHICRRISMVFYVFPILNWLSALPWSFITQRNV